MSDEVNVNPRVSESARGPIKWDGLGWVPDEGAPSYTVPREASISFSGKITPYLELLSAPPASQEVNICLEFDPRAAIRLCRILPKATPCRLR